MDGGDSPVTRRLTSMGWPRIHLRVPLGLQETTFYHSFESLYGDMWRYEVENVKEVTLPEQVEQGRAQLSE